MCQICRYPPPCRCSVRMLSVKEPGLGLCSTPGRNIGSILGWSWGGFSLDITSRLLLVDQLQRQLQEPRRTGLQNPAKRRRRHVVIRQIEVRVVGDVKAFDAELQPFRFA